MTMSCSTSNHSTVRQLATAADMWTCMSWFQCGATGRSKTAAAWATLIHSLTPPMTHTSGCRMSAAVLSISARKSQRDEWISPVAIGMSTAAAIAAWPAMSSGISGSSTHHGSIGLDHPDEPDRLGRCAPGVVGIERDAPVATDELADALDPRGVLVRPEPTDLDLDVREAELEVAADLAIDPLERIARPVVAARGVRRHRVAGPAEQSVDRLVGDLAEQVPQRDVHGRDRPQREAAPPDEDGLLEEVRPRPAGRAGGQRDAAVAR